MWPGWTMSAGLALLCHGGFHGTGAVGAEMPVVTPSAASIETVKAVPCWALLSRTISGRSSWRQRASVSVRQIRPRPILGHEVDRLGRAMFGGDDEIAFVLAVLVVDQDHHAAGAHVGDDVEYGADAHAVPTSVRNRAFYAASGFSIRST
jgi:hypothetical protein